MPLDATQTKYFELQFSKRREEIFRTTSEELEKADYGLPERAPARYADIVKTYASRLVEARIDSYIETVEKFDLVPMEDEFLLLGSELQELAAKAVDTFRHKMRGHQLPKDDGWKANFTQLVSSEIDRIVGHAVPRLKYFIDERNLLESMKSETTPITNNVDFSFLHDPRLISILERDYQELRILDPIRNAKSVIVLAGAIMEGLLFDALIAGRKWTFEQACEKKLHEFLSPAKTLGIISQDVLADSVRRYRNLIHPGREVKDEVVFDASDATLAKSAVDIFIRDVRAWSEREKTKQRLKSDLETISTEQKWFISLFAKLPDETDEYEHPWLEAAVYRSLDDLVTKEIITREEVATTKGTSQELISLRKEVIETVSKVIGSTPVRESILLDRDNIASSIQPGGGATGSGYRIGS